MALPRRPRGRPRSLFVFVLLLLTLALAAVLAYQAQDAARSHRATAERAIRDYAAFAAWELSRQVQGQLYEVVHDGLHPIAHESWWKRGAPMPHPRPASSAEDCGMHVQPEFYFWLDLREDAAADESVRFTGPAPPAGLRAWLVETVREHNRTTNRREWPLALVFGEVEGQPKMIVYDLLGGVDSAAAPVAAGYVAAPEKLLPALAHAVERATLLPPSLTAELPTDSLFAIRLLAGQRELFRSSARHASTYAAADTLVPQYGGFVSEVSLNPARAEQLVIGGLPRSRLPLLLGLLVLTAGLVAATLLQMRREAALARLRSDFVSGVSHELRTPLAQIRMFAETLLLGRTRSEQERHRSLEIIDQEARRLTHLVENVLHFSRAERQASRIDPEPTELAPQLREILESFAPLARARQTALRLEASEGIVVPVDRGALRQMLLNLLDNALKYGPAGQTVTVGMELAGESARIRVEDQGAGIPAAERERVWEAFCRLERDREAAIGGSGIGLAVVRELAELHGGRTWAEDAAGGGARFVIELPGAEATGRAASEAVLDAAGAAYPEAAAREAGGAVV